MARKRKSPYWTSTIGRMPMIAAPTAAPKNPSSAIGVLSIRSGNSCSRPSVTVNAPPQPPGTAMSSPRQNTDTSRRISSAIPSRSASAMLSRLMDRGFLASLAPARDSRLAQEVVPGLDVEIDEPPGQDLELIEFRDRCHYGDARLVRPAEPPD